MQDIETGPAPEPLPRTPSPIGLGNIDAYIRSANSFPLLSVEDERALARRFRDNGDLEAARALILPHLRFVIAVARGFAGYGLPHADLIQEGNLGLMKAVKRFDPERGVRLVTFAIRWIRAEINEYVLRNWRLVKIARTKAQRKLFFNFRAMKTGLAPLTAGEVDCMAKTLQVKREEVREMETRFSGRDVAFDGEREEDNAGAPATYLTSSDTEPSRQLEMEEASRAQERSLDKALSVLDPRSRRIIQARWLAEGRAAVLQDLASEFKVSAERIRQIEAKALQTMRKVMEASGLAGFSCHADPAFFTSGRP